MYSYKGGFNINSLQPAFSVIKYHLDGEWRIYAVPNIRGGGEYGKMAWCRNQTAKEKCFNDFICWEYLQKNGYTSKDYMALSGRSNGIACWCYNDSTPDLPKVAFPGVGVLDMLRYNKFTAGAGWAYDYGSYSWRQ